MVREADENLIQNNNNTNRETVHEINSKYIKYIKFEDAMVKQKS